VEHHQVHLKECRKRRSCLMVSRLLMQMLIPSLSMRLRSMELSLREHNLIILIKLDRQLLEEAM
jgi:hypothetical protein